MVRKTKFVFLNYLKSFRGVSCICRAHTEQYAFYTSPTKDIDVNNLFLAACVGYYIVKKDNFLELETPTGNFNTQAIELFGNIK